MPKSDYMDRWWFRERILSPEDAERLVARAVSSDARERSLRRRRRRGLRRTASLYRRAWSRGYEDGVTEAIKRVVADLAATRDRCAQAEASLVDLVFDVAEKVLGELPPDVVLPAMVRRALDDLQASVDGVVIDVHPDRLAATERALKLSVGMEHITLRGDAGLGADLCRIDLGEGALEVSLRRQLQSLRRVANRGP